VWLRVPTGAFPPARSHRELVRFAAHAATATTPEPPARPGPVAPRPFYRAELALRVIPVAASTPSVSTPAAAIRVLMCSWSCGGRERPRRTVIRATTADRAVAGDPRRRVPPGDAVLCQWHAHQHRVGGRARPQRLSLGILGQQRREAGQDTTVEVRCRPWPQHSSGTAHNDSNAPGGYRPVRGLRARSVRARRPALGTASNSTRS
jgi:hypothetical protein